LHKDISEKLESREWKINQCSYCKKRRKKALFRRKKRLQKKKKICWNAVVVGM